MKFYGVSVGPGDYELMTLKAVRILEGCKTIAVPRTHMGGTMALDIVKRAINIKDKNIIYLDYLMSRDAYKNREQHKINAEIIAKELENNNVAMISIGDISVFSSFTYILEIINKKGFDCKIIPGVPSFCAAAAEAQESLTVMKKPLHIIPGAFSDINKILEYDGTKVVMKNGKNLNNIIEKIENKNYTVVQNCGLENQIIYKKGQDREKLSDTYFTTILIKDD